ncbi:hypothetical protein ACNVED_05635 [Legionella sp. D16C41]|uniref:hypothetical protein n=1 Tax=Legionella sp. D16C41 TaxID=3402688 RepID=UPI003AF58498
MGAIKPFSVGKAGKDSNQSLSSGQLIQKLIKEAEKKEAAIEAMRSRCKICFREISPRRVCGGHGGGGGSGGGGESSTNSAKETTSLTSDKSLASQPVHERSWDDFVDFPKIDDNLDMALNEESFNPNIIADLLNANLLVIDNNRDANTLTIKLQCQPDSLTAEQRLALKKFINAILKEFHEFKKEHHIPNECLNIVQDNKGNIYALSIKLPTQALHDAFIHRLALNLLPSPTLKSYATKEAEHPTIATAPNPLSIKLTPTTKKITKTSEEEIECENVEQDKLTIAESEQQKIFHPSPLDIDLKFK